jgi:ABC-type nitrate/sulfonate/bicarbonate transport system permease component
MIGVKARLFNVMDQVLAIIFVILLTGLLVDKILFSSRQSLLHHRR